MISIKTTPKFNGIAIQGDFDDLNQLYDAISEYSNFYLNGILHEIESAYVKEHGVPIADMTPEQKNEYFNLHDSEITYLEDIRDNILGLCYDIRHAFQGDRNIVLTDNGQKIFHYDDNAPSNNLQFSANVLYPWAIYYLYVLQDMLDTMYKQEWFEAENERLAPYNELDIRLYRSVLETFITLLWKNLQELFDKEFDTLYNYFKYTESFSPLPLPYITGICNYLVADHCEKLTKIRYRNFKKNILLILAYDSMDSRDLIDDGCRKEPYVLSAKKQYKKACEYVDKIATRSHLTIHDFIMTIMEASTDDKFEITEAWVNSLFGNADWDNFEW